MQIDVIWGSKGADCKSHVFLQHQYLFILIVIGFVMTDGFTVTSTSPDSTCNVRSSV